MSVISKGIKTLKRAGSSIAHAGAYAGKHAAKLFNVNKGPAWTPAARMPRLNRTAKRPGAAMQVNLRTTKHVTFGENTSIPFETVEPGANQVIIIDMLPPQNRMPQSQARPDSKPSRGNPPPRPTTPAPTSTRNDRDIILDRIHLKSGHSTVLEEIGSARLTKPEQQASPATWSEVEALMAELETPLTPTITELPKARMGVGLQDDTLDATTTKFVWKQKPADAPSAADPSKLPSPQGPASR